MKVAEAPPASDATVSVYVVGLTVTTTPVPESLGEPEFVVYVPQLFGAARPSSVMTRLLAVSRTQFASPFELEMFVYVMSYVITAPGTASVGPPTPVAFATVAVLLRRTKPV